jgi:DNA polymerase-3 subunit delta
VALKANQIAASLKRGLAPVYLIGGDEPLLLQECCDLVRQAAKAQGFVEREILHLDGNSDWSVLQHVATPSLFATQKIIDLRMKTGKPGVSGAKALTEWAKDPDPSMVLLVSCEKWDASSRKSKWANALARAGEQIDIYPINSRELPGWLMQRMQAKGLQPDPEVIALLADRLEGNLLAANQEIDRLVVLKGQGPVAVEDVMKAVADSSRFDAFALGEHMLSGNLKDGLRVVAGLQRMNSPIPLILGALIKELKTAETFRLAMRAGENENTVFRRMYIWPNRQNTVRAAARRIDTRGFYNAFKQLALIDRQSKGRASGNPWQALDELLMMLAT